MKNKRLVTIVVFILLLVVIGIIAIRLIPTAPPTLPQAILKEINGIKYVPATECPPLEGTTGELDKFQMCSYKKGQMISTMPHAIAWGQFVFANVQIPKEGTVSKLLTVNQGSDWGFGNLGETNWTFGPSKVQFFPMEYVLVADGNGLQPMLMGAEPLNDFDMSEVRRIVATGAYTESQAKVAVLLKKAKYALKQDGEIVAVKIE